MSAYKEEVDYSDDPLVGVEIWGKNDGAGGEEMVDMVPATNIPVHTSAPSVTTICSSSSIGEELDPLIFSTLSPTVNSLWGSQTPLLPYSPKLDFVTAAPIMDDALTFIGATTHNFEQLNIGGAVPPFSTRGNVPLLASGVIVNVPANARVGASPITTFESEDSSEPEPARVCLHKGRKHRSTKNKHNRNSNFGSDRGMDDLEHTAAIMLVGKVRGRKYTTARLKHWTVEIWGGVLETLPDISLLTRGWFTLSFALLTQVDWVLNQYWHIEMHLVLLKRWSPLFDPNKENVGARPIWMHLLGLPVQFWNDTALHNIGEDFGHYLDHDRSYLVTGNRVVARILIFLDT